MNQSAVRQGNPIIWMVWDKRLAAQVALAIAGIVALTISAKAQIPWWPVPMTMQTYVVLVIGMAYGTQLGLITVGGYLVAGALGLPLFAGTPEKGIGLAYMVGPTGGYLVGFAIAAWLCGVLAQRRWDRHWGRSLAAMTLAHLVILSCGVLWLAALMGPERAVAAGLVPFVWATIAKTLLAAVTLPFAWRLAARARGESIEDRRSGE